MALLEAEKQNTTAAGAEEISLFEEKQTEENAVCSLAPEQEIDIFDYLEQCGVKLRGKHTIIVQTLKKHSV
ncbi:MAG: hypothetical protein LBM87_06020 [Ruminococcus sp.]|jgi:hypothetical protein|nr:hypothetical protein [Ruminococcus sp.]